MALGGWRTALWATWLTLVPVGGQAQDWDAFVRAATPLLDVRLRYEGVEEAGRPADAHALTLRLRSGLETGPWASTRLLIESEWVEALVDRYDDGIPPPEGRPVVLDPEAVEINRLHLTSTLIPKTTVLLGRQRINHDDHRFVGAVPWRQNEQTFDALRVTVTPLDGLVLDASHVVQVNRVVGPASPVGRIEGQSELLHASYRAPFGTLAAFGYLLDLDELPADSSATFGARFAGRWPVGSMEVSATLSYATQSDAYDNPLSYRAPYALVDGAVGWAGLRLGGGYEVLGSSDGVKGFATPLATLHAFQGWADRFLATPKDGVEDLYASLGYTAKRVAGLDAVLVSLVYHDFDAERTSAGLGEELNGLVRVGWQKLALTAKYAQYWARTYALDVRKVWFSVEYAL